MNNLLTLSAAQLNQAAKLKERIEALQEDLDSLLGTGSTAAAKRGPGRPRKAIVPGSKRPLRKRRKMSRAARAKMAAVAKARWAAVKAAGKSTL